MDHDSVQAWLDQYVAAWRSYDPEAIADLFTDDATYRYHPWDEPVVGAAAIADSWREPDRRDEPDAWQASYGPWMVAGDRAVATGTSIYDDAEGHREYHNVFLLEFDPAGRCRAFTELYALRRPD